MCNKEGKLPTDVIHSAWYDLLQLPGFQVFFAVGGDGVRICAGKAVKQEGKGMAWRERKQKTHINPRFRPSNPCQILITTLCVQRSNALVVMGVHIVR